MGLITKKTTTINVLQDENGNTIITPEQQKQINEFQSKSVTEECPACDGDGVVGCEYCDVCGGGGKFSYHTELRIVPIEAKKLRQMELAGVRNKEDLDILMLNMNSSHKKMYEGSIVFESEKSWDLIPEEINAISVDSRGEVRFYSHVSGIYSMYDDNHTRDSRHVGGQRWYFGTSKDGLDITEKYKDLDLIIPGVGHTALIYRPGIKPVVMDFDKPFDWSIFPKNATKLFVAFGDMDITNQEIDVRVTSNEMYLRDDNVIWGHGGRNHVDKCYDIRLCTHYIADGTGEYPVRKGEKKSCNEMNIHLKNIPYETVVYHIPYDRSFKIAPRDLKTLDDKKCEGLNRFVRPIRKDYTSSKYPFKYSGKKRSIEKWMLEHIRPGVFDYVIDNNGVINIDGDINMRNVDKLKHKFGVVTGKFDVLSDVLESLDNFPNSCASLSISLSKVLTSIDVRNIDIRSGFVKLSFMKLKDLKLPSNVKKVKYFHLGDDDGVEKISVNHKVEFVWDRN
jgi:hypothetical protein